MALTLASATQLLKRNGLLRELIGEDRWTLDPHSFDNADTNFTDITYDTRKVSQGGLLFCKGQFRAKFLDNIDDTGLAAYVSETPYADKTSSVGIIVNDVRRAMSLLAAEFFSRPQDSMTVVGITGTKGKTTTAYFVQSILNSFSGNKAALFSSVDNCLDGVHYQESDLTTPESLDMFRMMSAALDNGMRYLVMEVSSQAYKVDRVYGLHFDVGAFLNISPDHISPIEHPTFEDYLFCKRQITKNSSHLVLGRDCAHADLIREDAKASSTTVSSFALDESHMNDESAPSDDVCRAADCPVNDGIATVCAVPASDTETESYSMYVSHESLTKIGDFTLSIEGAFNAANAAAAIAIALHLGIPQGSKALHALESVKIQGRMERFSARNVIAYVDYAHNYASVTALLDFVDHKYGSKHPRITLVTGSAGNKAYDRRKEIVDAAQNRIARFIFTEEDTDTEPHMDICKQMLGYVSNDSVEASIVMGRTEAITQAIEEGEIHHETLNVILIIGKGEERWIKDHGKHKQYEGDDSAVERLLAKYSRHVQD
ncbi:UDP-N-acetylmuramoyl-L-alanyl-D-glutamate--2,6-diaminopimelate ligase [Bifidobacterium aquikefiri]|uniref:UDP-N-acetylmuramoyl-L-alanyl-D-glutamate--2, 6-diaminopimelate ligase n=1 Tax=Bifidobacterium aquikefiri TaxID=1653207 RepID=UPI0023F3A94C|nr:UDP-N-acetylmuramoyl-L-alanyl-D-glutamate--2,6-diaminopimelate ligase [Bifidobacterium aquikefiri]